MKDKDWQQVANVWEYRDGDLYWLIHAGRGASIKYPGDKVSTVPDPQGYCYVSWNHKHYAIHRVVFLLTYGWLPDCIDHIDGNPGNNNHLNLRAATWQQNQHNRRINKNVVSGVKNVTRHQGKWQVKFSIMNETKHFGSYNTIEEAKNVAEKIRLAMHKEFARHA